MLRYVVVLLAAASARASLSEASVAETQQYLRDWNLHQYLGDEVGFIFAK